MKIPLPIRGINKGMASADTPVEYSEFMENVRPRDILEGKLRIGSRPGLAKFNEVEIGNEFQPVVAMCQVSVVDNLQG